MASAALGQRLLERAARVLKQYLSPLLGWERLEVFAAVHLASIPLVLQFSTLRAYLLSLCIVQLEQLAQRDAKELETSVNRLPAYDVR